ncbi:galactofuranosyltransferase, partial [Lactobacillus reuteri]
QYPIFSEFLVKNITKNIRKYTNAKLYFITHDIDSLRLSEKDEEFQKREIEQLNQTDGLIVHNQVMKKWLKEQGVKVPMIELGIFDYDNHETIKNNINYKKRICFAGNLEKAPFLEKLTLKSAHMEIYGANPAKNYKTGVDYKGQFSPDDLLKYLDQDFGLVWDGDSVETCNGRYGNYLRYNDPHKASLYLSMGIPVIIWKEAALAKFISQNNLGITIDSLNDLDTILKQITENDYKTIKSNALQISEKLRNGTNIQNAVEKMERM